MGSFAKKGQNVMWEGCRWCLQQISILVSSYSFHGQLVLIFELRKPPFPSCTCREIRLTFLELLDCPTSKLVYSTICCSSSGLESIAQSCAFGLSGLPFAVRGFESEQF